MCASDRMLRGPALLLLAVCASCDDPGAALALPEFPPEVMVVAALDPGSAFQTVYVRAPGGGLPPRPVVARILRDGVVVVADTIEAGEPGDLSFCTNDFGRLSGSGVCLQLHLWPEPGAEYELRVEAPGRKEAWARTTVVGTFDLDVATVAGDPPSHAAASWSGSAGTHRYFLSVRSAETSCSPCETGWATYLDSTRYDGPVDAASLEEGEPPWIVQVEAMNRELYDFLTTGAGGDLFTVPPRQNVVDGHGVFGSRARTRLEGDLPNLRRGPWDLRSMPAVDLAVLRVDPSASDVLWVAGPEEVLRSGDGGSTWTTELEAEELAPASLGVGPDGTALVGRGGDLLRRDPVTGAWDTAATFEKPVRATLQVPGVAWIATAEVSGDVVHVYRAEATGGSGVTDGPWVEVGAVPHGLRRPTDIPKLVRDPTSGTLWLGLREAAPLFRSSDGGETWEPLSLPAGLLEDLLALPDGRLYAGLRGASDGIYLSRDAGLTWARSAEVPTVSVASHSGQPEQVWLGEQPLPGPGPEPPARVLFSAAAGESPEPTGFSGGDLRDLAVDPTGSRVYLLVGVTSISSSTPGSLSATAVLRLAVE